MRLSFAAALAATLASVNAFKDTSPFLMFSTSPLPEFLKGISRSQLQSSHSVLSTTKDFLKTCPSEIYYIISQPAISSSELSTSAPHLKMAVSNPAVRSRYGVSEVTGWNGRDVDALVNTLAKECAAKIVLREVGSVSELSKMREGKDGSVVVRIDMAELGIGREVRAEGLEDRDSALYSSILKYLPKGYQYTVIYTTTPSSESADAHKKPITYESTFTNEAFHMDLKRNMLGARESSNTTDTRPLFEKYQFLSPGLFMGLLTSLLLLAILSVGISAVSSLQVSYGAFDKEMGPAAQKKAL